MDGESAPAFRFNFGKEEAEQVQEEQGPPEYDEPAEELVYRPEPGVPFFTEPVEVAEGLTLVKGTISSDEAATILKDSRVAASDLVPGKYEGERRAHDTRGGMGEPGGMGVPGGMGETGRARGELVFVGDASAPSPGRRLQAVGVCGRPVQGGAGAVGEHLTGRGYGGHYDLILSSETIYSVPAQERLLECIKRLLQPPHGVALVAAKRYYFGVGGGSKSFKELVERDGIFETSVVEEKGSGNVREVLLLKFPAAIHPYFL
eukprot:XP_001694366.1 predicted protein [Chlamydomonas reinhardtii]